VLVVEILAGLACGVLLAAIGLTIWGEFRQAPGLSRTVYVVRWVAWVSLLFAAGWLLSQGTLTLSEFGPRLVVMAAVAAVPSPCLSSWDTIVRALPPLLLVGAALFWPFESAGNDANPLPVESVELIAIFCGGLGAQALGRILDVFKGKAEEPSPVAYTLLTLMVGGMALVSLWQRGSVGRGATIEGMLAIAWLVWSAARVKLNMFRWLRAGLIIVAASMLVTAALS
jgi:hypothetical protein